MVRLTMRNLFEIRTHRMVEMLLLSLALTASAEKLKEPSAKLVDLNGQPHSISELQGATTVVNFWATWCVPCKDEMPRLQKLSERYAAQGVKFVAISIDEDATQKKIPALLQKRDFRVPVWQGASPASLKELGLGELVPATIILDADGNIVGRIEGEAREKDITSRLDWVLNGRQGKPPKLVQKNDW